MMMPDGMEMHQRCIDSALTRLTWHHELCEEVGLVGVSQVWVEPPAWYVWLREGGAFLLRILEVEEWKGHAFGSYLVHRFPSPKEIGSPTYSTTEKVLLGPERFDYSTWTPKYDHFPDFADSFVIGEIGLVLTPSEQPGLIFSQPLAGKQNLQSHFFDFLISVLSFSWRSAPPYCCREEENALSPQFEIFDRALFREFLRDYEVDGMQSPEPNANGAWERLAVAEMKTHMSSTCGCCDDS